MYTHSYDTNKLKNEAKYRYDILCISILRFKYSNENKRQYYFR